MPCYWAIPKSTALDMLPRCTDGDLWFTYISVKQLDETGVPSQIKRLHDMQLSIQAADSPNNAF